MIVGPGGNSVKMAPYTFPAGGNFPGVFSNVNKTASKRNDFCTKKSYIDVMKIKSTDRL